MAARYGVVGRLVFGVKCMLSVDPEDIATCSAWALEWIERRQTVLPKRLVPPGPDENQCLALLRAAAAAPDHGQLRPWRFIAVPDAARAALGEIFAQALIERDPTAAAQQQTQAREKALRAPLLWLLVVDACAREPNIPLHERLISAGCAVQNVMLMALAMGFGSALTSGKALGSNALRRAFALHSDELAVCFISVGTVARSKPVPARPQPQELLSVWTPALSTDVAS